MQGQRELLIGVERVIGDERAKTSACEARVKQLEQSNTTRHVTDMITGAAFGAAISAAIFFAIYGLAR